MSKNITVYPEFKKCIPYVLDPFWKDVFSLLSINKFPKDVSYDKGILKHKNTTNVLEMTNDEKIDAYSVIKFLQDNCKLYSYRDDREELYEFVRNLTYDKIKAMILKDKVLFDYSEFLANKYFNETQTSKIFKMIKNGFRHKQITQENVFMENGKITDIDTLKYDTKKKELYFTLTAKTVKKATKKRTNPFYTKTEGYYKSLGLLKDKKAKTRA